MWAKRMETLLGPDDCTFIIRTREHHLNGMFLQNGRWEWVPAAREATQYTWGEVAVKCTNNRKLEAIRINDRGIAVDSKGVAVGLT